MNSLPAIAPEWLEVANSYLSYGSITETARALAISPDVVIETLARKDVKVYLNAIYLDLGYRNRDKIGAVLDKMIESKLQEAEESGVYSSKDLADLLMMAHKMRMEEIKAQRDAPTEIKQQTNVQINEALPGNYGALMERLLGSK